MNRPLVSTVTAVAVIAISFANASPAFSQLVPFVKGGSKELTKNASSAVLYEIPFYVPTPRQAPAKNIVLPPAAFSSENPKLYHEIHKAFLEQNEASRISRSALVSHNNPAIQRTAAHYQKALANPGNDFYELFKQIIYRHHNSPSFYNTPLPPNYYDETADLINQLNIVKTAKGYTLLASFLRANKGQAPMLQQDAPEYMLNKRELAFYAREELSKLFQQWNQSRTPYSGIAKQDWAAFNALSLFLRPEMRKHIYLAVTSDQYEGAAYLLQNENFDTPQAQQFMRYLAGSSSVVPEFTLRTTQKRITKRYLRLSELQNIYTQITEQTALAQTELESLRAQMQLTRNAEIPGGLKNVGPLVKKQIALKRKLETLHTLRSKTLIEQSDLTDQVTILSKKLEEENSKKWFPFW